MHAHLITAFAGVIVSTSSALAVERAARSVKRSLGAVAGVAQPVVRPHVAFGIVAESVAMQCALGLLEKFAPSILPAILCGPTGTGKTLLARYLHARGGPARPFVTITGAELAGGLAESGLYGHERGAFTGAVDRVRGVIAQAAGGTLFLDDLTFMPLGIQAKLLRVLDQSVFRPVGSTRDVAAQCRFVVGLNDDPDKLVAQDKLLEDLRERLGECIVHVAALAERRADIRPLAEHFLWMAPVQTRLPGPGRFAPEVLARFEAAPWERNVRQLEQTVYRAFVVARPAEVIELGHLPPPLSAPPRFARHGDPVQNALAVRYARALCGGRDDRAAAFLGIHRNALRRYRRDNS